MRKLALVLTLIPSLAFAATDSEAVTRLGRHLSTIEESAHKERVLSGALLTGFGAAGVVGFFVARNSSDPDVRDTVAPILGIAGGLFVIGGVISLLSPSEYETAPQEFKRTPDTDLRLKVTVGEDILRRLASRARRERLIGAGTLIAVGIGEVVWYAASKSTTSSRDWLLYNGIIAAGLGVVGFFVQRQPEEEWDAYDSWRGTSRKADLQFGIVASHRGLPGLGVRIQF